MKNTNSKKKEIFKSVNRRLFIAIIVSVGAFFATQMYITSIIGTSNAAIEEIRINRDEIRLENEILRSQIDEKKSTKSLTELAKRYNLTEQQIQKINTDLNDLAQSF
ncbi:hypothetical protein KC669_04215 [Candidatus Dojkabacteria bacterium]|uniref:Uncharacterized protein n=1 Tax=Candidatus Dojkabacteria bacterium TaxID=2099670 RepID=A0A955LBL9_9BACT|nr:hypothetical protein [Candidatus Dojkabacteria bacterium]